MESEGECAGDSERVTGGFEWLRAGVESEGECAGDSERVTGGFEWL